MSSLYFLFFLLWYFNCWDQGTPLTIFTQVDVDIDHDVDIDADHDVDVDADHDVDVLINCKLVAAWLSLLIIPFPCITEHKCPHHHHDTDDS